MARELWMSGISSRPGFARAVTNRCAAARDGARHAVHRFAFSFYPLGDEVTLRWLNEPCPGVRLSDDDLGRKRMAKGATAKLLWDLAPKFDRYLQESGTGKFATI